MTHGDNMAYEVQIEGGGVAVRAAWAGFSLGGVGVASFWRETLPKTLWKPCPVNTAIENPVVFANKHNKLHREFQVHCQDHYTTLKRL